MGAKVLRPPPQSLATDAKLPVVSLSPEKLLRISQYPDGEPYFGKSGANRFDAPGCRIGAPEFRSCYFGLSLEVAMAETLLHDETPINGAFYISLAALERSYVHHFTGTPLRVLDLTGATLKRLSGHADLAGTVSYRTTQQWALAVFNNPLRFDGFAYMSRHCNTDRAIVLFDRPAARLHHIPSSQLLPDTPGFAAAATSFNIVAA